MRNTRTYTHARTSKQSERVHNMLLFQRKQLSGVTYHLAGKLCGYGPRRSRKALSAQLNGIVPFIFKPEIKFRQKTSL